MKLIILIGFSRGLGKALFDSLIGGLKPGEVELLALGRNINNVIKHDGVSYQEADLLNDDCWDLMSTHIPGNIKLLDVFINASVIEPIGMIGNLNTQKLEDAVKVNYISPMKLVNKLISIQNKTNFAMNIFNISSGASSRAINGWSLYCSTKAALKMFLDVAEIESLDLVSVTHIDPGVMDTDMQKTIRSKSSKEMKNVQAFKELKSTDTLKSPKEAAEELLSNLGYS